MAKNLVIVESPTKAKTISRFLGKEYDVQSSNGHVRDLPKGNMGIDIESNFEPHYVIPTKSRKKVNELKKLAEKASLVYFATDEDREGEAISWHLANIFGLPEDKTRRIAFHEITKEAIKDALKNPRSLDLNLVDAQQARRVLDRLVGYELSPFLWKKVAKGLSAGRVQSVAVRLIVEREREIQNFKAREYWTIEGEFKKLDSKETVPAKLNKIAGKTLDKFAIPNEKEAKAILENLKDGFFVKEIRKKETYRNPFPPFTTSTLQQDANRKLGYSSRQTMFMAQKLYEGLGLGSEGTVGLITYMRTDSVNLARKFIEEARGYIKESFGASYLPKTARYYKAKSKLAQEAHEAIRPTDINRAPESIKPYVDKSIYKLYELIWQRALACQMEKAIIDSTSVDIVNKEEKYNFLASGSIIKFDGFLKVYPNNQQEKLLPQLEINEKLEAKEIIPEQHFTEPPARYSEAGLVKALEEYGIGRPSTYAPTIGTIIERGYVSKENRRLKPNEIGILVNDVLVEHFPKIVDYQFTANMENNLDEIAQAKKEWIPIIKEFYQPFKENLMQKMEKVNKKDLTEEATEEVCEKCGKPMVIKLGRFGKFLACTGFPDCKNTKPLNGAGEPEKPELTDEKCDLCGAPMQIKQSRYGKFLGCSKYPECKGIKGIEKTTGVKCPQCGKGDIVEKRSKRGKTFYSCNQYPNCKFALWSKPTGEKCPDCENLLVYGKGNTSYCSNTGCKFKK
ncbi:MAG: type I DNA topoisomerase [Candidatus Kerfeldbacteria bacterium CG08_land_8_20_14_0_20_40_16]|uniref:DNA topoisomerase 1 n=1 Tax=Candidatus Kerfeldbacteria bacterium CG08_land_8_20_14_0_20_40_16 TaxID=2014244 RepID=A0A2H0YVB8_9BACT|nr:MAG: type I DNA topoisomerase [Candidatus Kerfeldbacteria bacterium CG08_land_8_20_14_0_20_40_16]